MHAPLLLQQAGNSGKPCACVGVRHCALCKDPEVRQKFGLHNIPKDFDGATASDNHFVLAKLMIGQELGSSSAVGSKLAETACLVEIVSAPAGSGFCMGQRVPLAHTGLTSLCLFPEFVTEAEENHLMSILDALPDFWQASQSGRRKRDFGPAINYNKQKVTVKDNYKGVPTDLLAAGALRRLRELDLAVKDSDIAGEKLRTAFLPAGWFFQEYMPERGSNFDPHIDHAWVWGERILDLSLLGDAALSFFSPGFFERAEGAAAQLPRWRIDVPLPRRSLLVFQGDARNVWQHAVLEDSVGSRRVSLTVRELSAQLKGTGIGSRIEHLARTALP
mmetsp:Transcript_147590/g.411089  ORF Transcript_147590/g.411089 Transcript_147590/m.411089 type:complete len:333 (-) Transcript_147590:47-1045(-)